MLLRRFFRERNGSGFIRRYSSESISCLNVFDNHQSYTLKNGMNLHICKGDLTKFYGDAIVNAANERLLGGGGVDGAIHRACGKGLKGFILKNVPLLDDEMRRCRPGDAIATPAFDLNTKNGLRSVIHTVGPVYNEFNGSTNSITLGSCYLNCLKIAMENGFESIAFPAISCGAFGYPALEAMSIALNVCEDFENEIDEMEGESGINHDFKGILDAWFILYSDELYSVTNSICKENYDPKRGPIQVRAKRMGLGGPVSNENE